MFIKNISAISYCPYLQLAENIKDITPCPKLHFGYKQTYFLVLLFDPEDAE